MANLCVNSVYLVGDKPSLQTIINAHSTLSGDEAKDLSRLQEKLGVVCEGWGCSYDDGLSEMKLVDDNTLHLFVTTAWSDVNDFWRALVAHLGLKDWAVRSEYDRDIVVSHDSDGKFFPENFVLDIYDDTPYDFDDDRYEFKNEEELLAFLDKKTGLHYNRSQYEELFDDNDYGTIVVVERD